jgi:uncharacterized protein YjbI with pentapeptide repeats
MVRKTGAWTILCGLGVTLSAGITVLLTDRQADLEEQRWLSERLDQIQDKLNSEDVADQRYGIMELQRTAEAENAPDNARELAIDRISAFLRETAKATDTKTCGTPNVHTIAETSIAAIGVLNNSTIELINLSNTCLVGVEVRDANLTNAFFTKANLDQASFTRTKLINVRFDFADLHDTEFTLVDLTSAVFCSTDIGEADFRSGTFARTALHDDVNAEMRHRSIDLSEIEVCG